MQKRQIGKTDIWVSTLGLGTVKFGRNEGVKYPHPFALPTDHEIKLLLDTAKELGINLLDTAPAYGNSEERLGTLLKHERESWIISTKAGETFINGKSHFDFSKQALEQSIERSLKRLQTDYLDIVLIHSNGEDDHLIDDLHVFDTLSALKTKGLIRAYGMSTKTVSGGLKTLSNADIAMVTYHPEYLDEQSVLDFAHTHHKSIFVKKALGSGHLAPKECLPFIFKHPSVTTVITGTLSPLHLRENAALTPA